MSLSLGMSIAAVAAGLFALVWGADRFIFGAAALARNLGVAPLVVGLTIVAFGTSAPEMLVSAMAAWSGNPELSVGNALGSNIANVGLVLGASALVRPLAVHSKIVRRELPLLLVVSAFALVLTLDRSLGRIDGILLLLGMGSLVVLTVREGLAGAKAGDDPLVKEFEAEVPSSVRTGRATLWFVVGLLTLLAGSRLLVTGAVSIARIFEIDELIIGLTIVAVGTSLPELAASVVAAFKGEDDIAIGNVVGSNVWNLLAVLAIPGVLAPGAIDDAVLFRDFPVMIALTAMLLAMSRTFGENPRLDRVHGGFLLLSFVGYVVLLSFESF